MDNKFKPASPIVGADHQSLGLSKLEAYVMHNMPPMEAVVSSSEDWKINLSGREKAQIRKTIEACKYALSQLESSDE